MTTITVWLLVSIGSYSGRASINHSFIERFATLDECQRVAASINKAGKYEPLPMACIQATVVRSA